MGETLQNVLRHCVSFQMPRQVPGAAGGARIVSAPTASIRCQSSPYLDAERRTAQAQWQGGMSAATGEERAAVAGRCPGQMSRLNLLSPDYID